MSDTTEDEKLMSEIGYVKVVVQKDHRSVTKYRHPEYNDVSVWLAKALTAHIAQKQLQAKKDLLAEVRELQHYKWMCETLHGGYNADEKDVHAALKRYSEREDLRADFAAFFESAAIKEIEEGLTQDTKGGKDEGN